ncbi:crotonobetainyl-CoA:carnitine CoA-transferase [compost metagenome]
MLLPSHLPDGTPISLPGIVPKLGSTPGQIHRPAPTLGQHTDEVLSELGIAPDVCADWRSRGII